MAEQPVQAATRISAVAVNSLSKGRTIRMTRSVETTLPVGEDNPAIGRIGILGVRLQSKVTKKEIRRSPCKPLDRLAIPRILLLLFRLSQTLFQGEFKNDPVDPTLFARIANRLAA